MIASLTGKLVFKIRETRFVAPGAAALLISAVLAVAISVNAFGEDKTTAELKPRAEAALQRLAPSLTLKFRLTYSPINATWAHGAEGTVKADGTAEVTVGKSENRRKVSEQREGRLNDVQRLELLKRILSGLDHFEVDHRKPESDEADVRMKVVLGSATITTRGCFDHSVYGPVRFLVNTLPKKGEQDGAAGASSGNSRAESEAAVAGDGDQVALRRNVRRLINGQLPQFTCALQISESKKQLLQLSLNERGYLISRGDEETFPQLANAGKTATKEDRDRLLDRFARSLEGFSFAVPRDPEPKESPRSCRLSLVTPCYELTVDEINLGGNVQFSGDIDGLIDSVRQMIGVDR